MYRKREQGDLFHTFTESNRHKEWLWEEVAVARDDGQGVCTCRTTHGRSRTWREAIGELHDIESEEE